MTTNDIDAIRQLWLNPCGPCDAGLPALCGHPDSDERPVIAALCDEVEQLRAELAKARQERDEYAADNQRVAVSLVDVQRQLTAANHRADGLAADYRSAQQANTAYANEVAALEQQLADVYSQLAAAHDEQPEVAR